MDLRYFFMGTSFPRLLAFLWVICMNALYNNIFSAVEVNECIRKQPSYMRSQSYFAAFLQTLYYYSNVQFVSCRGAIELRRCSIHPSQRSSPWNDLFVPVTQGAKFSWRHYCATIYSICCIFGFIPVWSVCLSALLASAWFCRSALAQVFYPCLRATGLFRGYF